MNEQNLVDDALAKVMEQGTIAAMPEFCGRPGTGECSCAKFGADSARCERLLEWKQERLDGARDQ